MCSFGAAFTPYYRLVGPYRSPEMEDVVKEELWETITRRGIAGNLFMGVVRLSLLPLPLPPRFLYLSCPLTPVALSSVFPTVPDPNDLLRLSEPVGVPAGVARGAREAALGRVAASLKARRSPEAAVTYSGPWNFIGHCRDLHMPLSSGISGSRGARCSSFRDVPCEGSAARTRIRGCRVVCARA